jgi:ribonucleoside-diphosphate reductase alpha chain
MTTNANKHNPTEVNTTPLETESLSQKNSDLQKSKQIRPLVVKRNGILVPFNLARIEAAIKASFEEVLTAPKTKTPTKEPLPVVGNLGQTVKRIASRVEEEILKTASPEKNISVEEIQDFVELQLMESGFFQVARAYIRYREEHKVIRDGSPQALKVQRRDGKVVRFNLIKIVRAVERAFRAQYNVTNETPQFIVDTVNNVSEEVIKTCLAHTDPLLEIEWIQDEVEKTLMKLGWYQIAKSYILYRSERQQARNEEEHEIDLDKVSEELNQKALSTVVALDGVKLEGRQLALSDGVLLETELYQQIIKASKGLNMVAPVVILKEAWRQFFPGMSREESNLGLVMAARSHIEKHPDYSYLTARLLLDNIYSEVGILEGHKLEEAHRKYFISYVKTAVEYELLATDLLSFDLEKLANAIEMDRDRDFSYLGLQTLYDRYLIHKNDRRIETPQAFWMRVSMGLALKEQDKEDRAIEFYNLLSKMDFVSSTPTLFNSGTRHSQMSSCYLTTIDDDLSHIFKCISDDAQLSKWAGGLGNDWTNVRATGASIKGTNGRSQGIIPFLKVANDTAVAVNQGGKRKGAMCAYLETWHLDIEEFLELRKNTGDERRRTHDMNTANWIPDLFMKRIENQGSWTLFSPSDVPDLHDLYGQAFEKQYTHYEQMAETGAITLFKKVEALTLWRKMLSMLFETGHPWITFKDPSNIRSPQDHVGVVHSSNLCTEILLNTSPEETAVCNLGSINLANHTKSDGIDKEKLALTIRTAVRMLDNVIDINFYPTAEAKTANLRHRPIGLGIMGFQEALYALGISYASEEAVEFADNSMEAISYYSLLASTNLAQERGSYESFVGSKWQRGILPIDSITLLEQERGAEFVDMDKSSSMDWSVIREAIKSKGLRNSNTLAIAPTATISNIAGVAQSIEPMYKHLFSKSNLSGEFIVHNPHLVADLEKRGIWDDEMVDDLKYFDGSIAEIARIPDDVKRVYLTAFEIDPEWLIECASRRQKWIDMGQSLNLYISNPSGRRLHEMYMLAWKMGLKTTYYLRATAATQIEKSTSDVNKRGLQPRWMKSKSASSEIQVERTPDEKTASKEVTEMPIATCNLDGDCESCQ